jgi:lipopolysaccharide/colanic/teichoic acid biosynthesis glycosyltransferase
VSEIQCLPFLLTAEGRSGFKEDFSLFTLSPSLNCRSQFIIVGAGWAGQTIAEEILKHSKAEILGFLDDRIGELKEVDVIGRKVPVVGDTRKMKDSLEEFCATDLVVAITHEREDHLLKGLMEAFESEVRVHQMPDLYAQLTGKIPLKHIGEHWVLPRLRSPVVDVNSVMINVLDYAISLLLFFGVLIPLLPLIGLIIKLDSPGPIFFVHKRVGLRGKRFTLIKFRSMSNKIGANFSVNQGDQITKWGHWMRKLRIDELPQLINILKGEMSLVGPRPETVRLVNCYKDEIPFYKYRHMVKPGLTGWAQVNMGHVHGAEKNLQKLQYDLFFILRRTVWLHLRICLRTVYVALTGFGAK